MNSRANSVDTETIAFCTPSGVLEVVDLLSGKLVMQTHLPMSQMTIKQLADVRVRKLANTYLVQLQTITDDEQTQVRRELQRGSLRYDVMDLDSPGKLMYGYLLSIDSATGQPIWDRPVKVEHFQFLDITNAEIPFAVLGRRVDIRLESDATYHLQFVVLDLRTGRESGRIRIPFLQIQNVQAVCLPAEQSILIGLNSQSLQLTFSDEPPPPSFVGNLNFLNTLPDRPITISYNADTAKLVTNRDEVLERLAKEQTELERLSVEFEQQLERLRSNAKSANGFETKSGGKN